MLRIITGVIAGLIMIPVCIFSGTIVWPLVITMFSVIAVEEMLHCIGMHKEHAFSIPARIFAFLPIISYVFLMELAVNAFRSIFIFSALFFFAEQIIAMLNKNRLHTEKLYSMIALILYVVIALTAIVHIRYIDDGHQEGKYIYLLVFFGAWFTDTFAYFIGRWMGKTPLAPEISPKKTVEGSIGGIVANMLCFAGYAWILRSQFDLNANILFFAILGALFSVVGQFGDLFASGIKRHYGVKDFGKFFPGHGGVLDRVDSILANASVMFFVYASFGVDFLIL